MCRCSGDEGKLGKGKYKEGGREGERSAHLAICSPKPARGTQYPIQPSGFTTYNHTQFTASTCEGDAIKT